jgi:hypothetical protein
MATKTLANLKRFAQFGLIAAASGCAATSMSTGILPVGPDTYTITERYVPVRGGAFTAQQSTLTQGNAYCAAQGKQFMALDKQTLPGMETRIDTGYSVTFRCLEPGTQVPLPAEVVEHQQKP